MKTLNFIIILIEKINFYQNYNMPQKATAIKKR